MSLKRKTLEIQPKTVEIVRKLTSSWIDFLEGKINSQLTARAPDETESNWEKLQ